MNNQGEYAMKTLTLRMPDDLHQRLKVLSASTGITMSELLMKAVHVITKQKGVEETTFRAAFEKLPASQKGRKYRSYTQKELEEFLNDDRI